MAPRDLVIVGAGGHGRELLDVVEAINDVTPTWRLLGFLDDGRPHTDRLLDRGAAHLGSVAVAADLPYGCAYVLGIGDGAVRARLDTELEVLGLEPVTLVHPLASVGSVSDLAPGVVLMPGACITTNVRLGRHTHLNVRAVVQHDTVVGDYVTFSPGTLVNGDCRIGDHVFTGSGAVITRGRTVGERARVGAGAVVLDDVDAHALVVGVPARAVTPG